MRSTLGCGQSCYGYLWRGWLKPAENLTTRQSYCSQRFPRLLAATHEAHSWLRLISSVSLSFLLSSRSHNLQVFSSLVRSFQPLSPLHLIGSYAGWHWHTHSFAPWWLRSPRSSPLLPSSCTLSPKRSRWSHGSAHFHQRWHPSPLIFCLITYWKASSSSSFSSSGLSPGFYL